MVDDLCDMAVQTRIGMDAEWNTAFVPVDADTGGAETM